MPCARVDIAMFPEDGYSYEGYLWVDENTTAGRAFVLRDYWTNSTAGAGPVDFTTATGMVDVQDHQGEI